MVYYVVDELEKHKACSHLLLAKSLIKIQQTMLMAMEKRREKGIQLDRGEKKEEIEALSTVDLPVKSDLMCAKWFR